MIQEAARLTIGVLILFSLPLLLVRVMIIIKVALAPFHFWVVTALHSLNG
jgi:NADH:ubiquinone oxidoreductase subunit 2 (subunit N)